MPALRYLLTALLMILPLSGCDMIQQKLGLESTTAKAERDDADGKAVGGGCRQSGRAIEDCYSVYAWLPRPSIYAGWRDMDVYMRENNLETISPQLPPPSPPPPPPPPPPKNKKKTAPVEPAAESPPTEKN